MKKGRRGTVLTACYCTCIVVALMLLHGCSGATKIESTEPVTTMTSETIETEWAMETNPNTGERELLPVNETHTTVTQTSSVKISESEEEGRHSHERTDYY